MPRGAALSGPESPRGRSVAVTTPGAAFPARHGGAGAEIGAVRDEGGAVSDEGGRGAPERTGHGGQSGESERGAVLVLRHGADPLTDY